jgi:hypothetical protein
MKPDILLALGVLMVAVVACGKDPTPISTPVVATATTPDAENIRVPDGTPPVLPQPELTPTVVATAPPRPDELETTRLTPPEATSTPEAAPNSSGVAAIAPQAGRTFEEPPERDLFDLARRLRPGTEGPASRVVNPDPVSYEEGHEQVFWVSDLVETRDFQIQATLKLVSEHAYWYVDDSIDLKADDLARAAESFETEILPLMTSSFGEISNPGIDNDPRLTVLHTPLPGVDGYYGAGDEFPSRIHPHSNEREIIYIDGSRLIPGTPHYLGVLTHELQHAVHWNLDHGEDAWVNEGMSEVAKELAGNPSRFIDAFLRLPATQLNYWPDGLGRGAPHYGASALFLTYLAKHYGGFDRLQELVLVQADGINGVNDFLSQTDSTFIDVFKDWVVANYVNAPDGPYGYNGRDVRVRKVKFITAPSETSDTLPQFAARYYDLRLDQGDSVVSFQGDTEVAQIETSCHSGAYCWWSNRGDGIDSTLTREFDLTGLDRATLEFWTWFRIERGWDYAYVEVSTDGGSTWTVLSGDHTSSYDPVGNGYGDGFTGSSGDWVQEKVDLSPYTGAEVQVRFEYVTDDAVYLDGFAVDDISVPELGFFDDAEQPLDWRTAGFLRIDNVLSQEFAVQLVLEHADGKVSVREVDLDANQAGQIAVRGFGSDVERAVVVVSPITRGTQRPAQYTLTVGPGE